MKRLANEYVTTKNGQAELEGILANTTVDTRILERIKDDVTVKIKEEKVKFHTKNYELLVSLGVFALLLLLVLTFNIPSVFDWFDQNIFVYLFNQ